MEAIVERVAVIPDCHVPYHDDRAFSLALKVFQDFRPTQIVFLGDVADFYSVSSHRKDPDRQFLLEYEVQEVNKLLDRVARGFPKAKVTFLEGNHEYRLARYISEQCPELFGCVSVEGLLKIKERGWKFIPFGEHHQIGKMVFVHRGASGRNAAYKAISTYEKSVCMGDLHRMEEAIKVSSLGECHIGIIPGWLGDYKKAARYMMRPFADWQLGFATIYLVADGNFFHGLHPIVNYRTMYNGRIYAS